ncbi:MAG TPA: aspartate aminotransferase family protein [Actinomycetota bacterium]|nr:aspartate aminotransferase family protein [Actinomycetota bacterium]
MLALVEDEARRYTAGVDDRPLRSPDADRRADAFSGPIPEEGVGALSALQELVEQGLPASVSSSGPRFFHYVIGGVTPAALGAAWLTDAIDQNPGLWDASPMGSALGRVSLEWLLDLFGLPGGWGGTIVTGGTMANYAGLAAARRWWGLRHGVDIDEQGMAGLPQAPVFSSGYVHSSAKKVVGMLGLGRQGLRILARDGVGRMDLDALRSSLDEADGPAIVIANAGEVNAGDFDPIAEIADVCAERNVFLHVDGAFGLFAAVSPSARHLVEGIERADSVSVDGHKWLNVPYDTGFAFVRDPDLLDGAFTQRAAYLTTEAGRSNLMWRTPESSQRARGLAVWATLKAYGREGYRKMVEGHLALAQRVAERVDAAPDLERLAEVPLNIVCFRYRPSGVEDHGRLDDLNRRIGEEILADGRVYVGTTVYDGKVAFRPAIVNWRTREEDVDLLVEVVRELGSRLI